MKENKPSLLSWTLFLLLALIWGSSYILIKYSLKAFEPLQLGTLRVFIAFVALSPFLLIRKFRDFRGKQWIYVVLVGLLGSAIPAVLFATAQTKIDSSLAAILNALVPLSTLVTGALFFKERFTGFKIAGVMLGVAGSAAIILTRTSGMLDGKNVFALLVILAGICYAVETNILKHYLGSVSAMGLTVCSFACIGPLAGILAFQSGVMDVMTHVEGAWQALGFLAILSVMGTAVAITLFNQLIQDTTPLFASAVTYLIPVVALMWGIRDGEIIGWIDFLGLGCILLGIYLTGK